MNNTAQKLDGKAIAQKKEVDLAKKIGQLKKNPGLAAVLIGDDASSEIYIKLKEKACNRVGITFSKYLCNDKCFREGADEDVVDMINFLNRDPEIDAILIQLPLPKKFDTEKILAALDPQKDVDGFIRTDNKLVPPTINAVLTLLKETKIDLTGLSATLITKNSPFTDKLENYLPSLGIKAVDHIKKITSETKIDSDIVISALGSPKSIKKSMIKKDAIVIDVGISRVNKKTIGDVDESVEEVASFISPVPGGVGPLTVAHLLENVYLLVKK